MVHELSKRRRRRGRSESCSSKNKSRVRRSISPPSATAVVDDDEDSTDYSKRRRRRGRRRSEPCSSKKKSRVRRSISLPSATAVLDDDEDSGDESSSTEDEEFEAFKTWVPADLVSQQEQELNAEFAMREKKLRRFPVSLSALYEEYSDRVTVPIGHYKVRKNHHDIEVVKNVATHYYFPSSADRIYRAFCSALGDVRILFSDLRAPTIEDDELKLNLFRDGCFLLQYMRHMCISGLEDMPPSLAYYFDTNQAVINRDMMLLENQLPWVVIQILRSYKEVPVEDFIAKMARTLRIRKGAEDNDGPFDLDASSYTPPHLLGLLWAYKTGKIGSNAVVPSSNQNKQLFSPFIEEKWFSLVNCCCCYNNNNDSPFDVESSRQMSRTISAIELAEIGIKLKASKTTKFTDMGIKKGLFGCEIFLAPLLLDGTNRCWLVNMAVFELYMASSDDTDRKHAIRPYLVVLAMLMDREEDVHRLRSKGLINGALTNKEILDFFKGLVKHISGGPPLVHLMEEIEDYKLKRWMWIKVHKFFYRNYKIILAVLSAAGVLVGIFKALLSLKHD